MKTQPFFKAYPLTIWNILTIIAYTLFSTGLLYYYVYEKYPSPDYLLVYIFGTQLSLIVFQYRVIRNLYMYMFWLLIGITHVITAHFIKDILLLQFPAGHLSIMMANTLFLVIILQVLRYISLKLQEKEFVVPSRSGTDLFDERNPTWIDYLCTFSYLIILFLGMFIMPKHLVEKPATENSIEVFREATK